jgi:hypothetical protein
MYASEVLPAASDGGFATLGLGYQPGNPYTSDQTDPAVPPQYAALEPDPNLGFPSKAGFVPTGGYDQHGPTIYVNTDAPFYTTANTLVWHSSFYRFGGASGTLTPQVRGNDAVYGFSPIHTYPTISIPAGPAGVVDVQQAIQPSIWTRGAGNWKLFLYDYEQSQQGSLPSGAMNGPLYSIWQRLEDANRSAGIAYSTLLYQGGKSARDAALSLRNAPDAALAEWMRQETRLQNVPAAQAMLLVQIEHGGNDLNNPALSVGANPAPTNTPAGFEDNLSAIIGRLRQVWNDNGYDLHKLYFAIGPYHTQPPIFSQQEGLESGAMQLADSTYNVTVVRGSKLISPQTMQHNGMYDQFGTPHLSKKGYETIARLGVNQLVSSLPEANTGRSAISSLTFTFASDGGSFDPNYLQLDNLTTQQRIDPSMMSYTYDGFAGVLTYTFPGLPGDVLPVGDYQAKLIMNLPVDFGARIVVIDDPPNVPGNFVYNFTAEPASLAVIPEPASTLTAAVLFSLTITRPRRPRRGLGPRRP